MAIQLRRGNQADLDATRLQPGEIAVCLDTGKVIVKLTGGNYLTLADAVTLETALSGKADATATQTALSAKQNNYKDAWYCFDDDPGTAYCGVWDGSTMTHDVIIVFPFSVTVESITISQKEVGYSTQAGINAGKIYVNTAAKTKTSDSGWTEWCALSRGSGAAAGTDTVSTTHYPSASYSLTDPVRSIRVRGTSWGVNGTTKYGHIICGISIRYTADPTAVEAWKAQYGIN